MSPWRKKSAAVEFKDDDDAYFAWLTAHPDGYVLNVRRWPDPSYVVLHRASCGSISSAKLARGAYTCRNYRKWCSGELSQLKRSAKLEGRKDGSFSKRCEMCHPPAG